MDRRSFLKLAAQTAGASLIGPSLAHSLKAAKAPKFKISLAQWSLHRALGSGMDNLDFAKAAREDYGIGAIEYVNSFFKDKARDEKYLAQMIQRAKDHGVESRLIMIDGEGALGDPDPVKRSMAVLQHHQWVNAAATLGCFAIRVNAASSGTYEEQQKLAADGLRRLVEYGAAAGIAVIVENHGGLSSNGQWLSGVMKLVDHPMMGTLPDFGNFNLGNGQQYDRYKGVQELMPYAKAVSAKTHVFDAQGNEREIDYPRMMKIVEDAGYHSFMGIEYEGDELSEPDGIRATKKLLERLL
ncbi:MAG: TIM barrel protein [Chthonomonadaceae bacterium]|nr:TIM barrel protein [Chthonomonadaceae bacterium]